MPGTRSFTRCCQTIRPSGVTSMTDCCCPRRSGCCRWISGLPDTSLPCPSVVPGDRGGPAGRGVCSTPPCPSSYSRDPAVCFVANEVVSFGSFAPCGVVCGLGLSMVQGNLVTILPSRSTRYPAHCRSRRSSSGHCRVAGRREPQCYPCTLLRFGFILARRSSFSGVTSATRAEPSGQSTLPFASSNKSCPSKRAGYPFHSPWR